MKLGIDNGQLSPCGDSPNAVCSHSDDPRHQIEPLEFTGSHTAAMAKLRTILERLPRAEIVQDEEHYLHVEVTSRWLRFVDDVEFLCEPETGRIHFRSASRVGYYDFGVNRKRMEQIRVAFQAEMAEQVSDE